MINRIRLNAIFKKLGNDVFLATGQSDVFYISGLDLEGCYLLFFDKKLYVVSSPMLSDQVRTELPGISLISGANLAETLIKFLKHKGIRSLTINPDKINHSFALKLSRGLNLKSGDLLTELRSVKDAKEKEIIEKSCKIALNTFNRVRKLIKPGVTESEIAFKIEEYFAKYGSKPAFPPIVAFGPHTANPHHIPTLRKLRKNDIITIDLGCAFRGYCSDLTRTFFLDKIPLRYQKVYIIIEEAQKAAIRAVKTGLKVNILDKIARDIIEKNGFGKFFIHSTGHGVGIEVHEMPRINGKNESALLPGMVITVEPGVYFPGKFGIRIEDTVLVTDKGPKILTK